MKNILAKTLRLPRRIRAEWYKRWNKVVFHLNGIKFGKGMLAFCKIHVKLAPGSKVVIGNNFTFVSGEGFNPICRNIQGSIFTQTPEARITIGNNTGMSSACLWCKESITIGNNVKIGGDCIIIDTDCHNLNCSIRRSLDFDSNGLAIDSSSAASAPIVIEDDVFVGARCIILKGVTIGARSIIGAGSVVVKSIPQDCIVAGNPAKVIKK